MLEPALEVEEAEGVILIVLAAAVHEMTEGKYAEYIADAQFNFVGIINELTFCFC